MKASVVALKLPEFWEQQATAWFAQLEAQFSPWDFTADDTTYYYVVVLLSSSTALQAVTLLNESPERDKYVKLSNQLIKLQQIKLHKRHTLKRLWIMLLSWSLWGQGQELLLTMYCLWYNYHGGQQSMNAVDTGHTGCLHVITDNISGWNDTGAQVSVLPVTPLDNPLLEAAKAAKSQHTVSTKLSCVLMDSVSLGI